MMTEGTRADGSRSLRLWPGVVIVGLQWFVRFAVPAFAPDALLYAMLGGLAGGVAILVWWLFFSRAPWSERLGAVALVIVALAVAPFFLHESIATGAMGFLFPLLVIPLLSLAFVTWAVSTRDLRGPRRWATMAAAVFLPCLALAVIRTGGFTGGGDHDLAWRWSTTPEERLLAREGGVSMVAGQIASAIGARTGSGPEWPGFRGASRDAVARGPRIATDWVAKPPIELWRRPIGPGWSSFAVHGDRVFTQEQRGEDEVVSCYDARTGDPVWMHADPVRFWESNAGAGPRGTPTLHDGRVYALGATGILNALDAADGSRLWSRDAAAETRTEVPTWGFSSSPLVVDDLVVVAAAGALAAYDKETGQPRWRRAAGAAGESYSSPQLARLAGVEQILFLEPAGLVGLSPTDGSTLWEHGWKGFPIVQPGLAEDGDLLFAVSDHSGVRRLRVSRDRDTWAARDLWTSSGLKPYFNDFVVHGEYAYGFDGGILAAIELDTGARVWKGGRYGHGQLVLLPDQDLLLVLSERGEIALVSATPDGFAELARAPALEGKTWNHPVVVGDRLLVRNGVEMAAFRLAPAAG